MPHVPNGALPSRTAQCWCGARACVLPVRLSHTPYSSLSTDRNLRKRGPLAVTDANLVLGRLVPQYFPKIFGKNADEGLDAQASLQKFEELAKEINSTYGKKLDLDEIVYGSVGLRRQLRG